jgi:hypothetical protein
MISQEDVTQTEDALTLEQRRAFMKLPLEERRKILAQQAEQMVQYYEAEPEQAEREQWQGGDVVEY